jgi:hypothetical protein
VALGLAMKGFEGPIQAPPESSTDCTTATAFTKPQAAGVAHA